MNGHCSVNFQPNAGAPGLQFVYATREDRDEGSAGRRVRAGRRESFSSHAVLREHHAVVPAVAPHPGLPERNSRNGLRHCTAPAAVRADPAWGIIALSIAVFPVNIHMAVHSELFPQFSPAALWLRLPLQAAIIAWAYWFTRPEPETRRVRLA